MSKFLLTLASLICTVVLSYKQPFVLVAGVLSFPLGLLFLSWDDYVPDMIIALPVYVELVVYHIFRQDYVAALFFLGFFVWMWIITLYHSLRVHIEALPNNDEAPIMLRQLLRRNLKFKYLLFHPTVTGWLEFALKVATPKEQQIIFPYLREISLGG